MQSHINRAMAQPSNYTPIDAPNPQPGAPTSQDASRLDSYVSSHQMDEKDGYDVEKHAEQHADSGSGSTRAESSPEPAPVKAVVAGPPDGGRDAWLTVLGGWCGLFISFGWLNSVGVFQEYYQDGPLKSYGPSNIAWIASTEIFFIFVCGPIAGKLFDSYGPRWVLLVGSFMHVFGVFMISLGYEYYQFFLAQSVCSAIGCSLIFYACLNSVSTWFLKKRATAVGIVVSGSSLGGVLLPIMLTRLIPEAGFGWAVRAVGFLFLGLATIANLTTKSRLTHTPKRFEMMEFVRPLSEPPFAVLVLGSFFFFFGTFLPYNYLILQGQKVGTSYSLSQYLIPILNAGSIPGRILPGILADRFGRFNMIILVSGLSAIFVLAIWLPSTGDIPVIIFAALYGFTSGAYISLGPAVVAQISEIREIGVRNGSLYFCVSVGALIGNPIGGALISRDGGNFHYMQILCGVVMAVGFLLLGLSRYLKVGFSKKIF